MSNTDLHNSQLSCGTARPCCTLRQFALKCRIVRIEITRLYTDAAVLPLPTWVPFCWLTRVDPLLIQYEQHDINMTCQN